MTPDERPVADASWDEHYRDERDAALLYRALAGGRDRRAARPLRAAGRRRGPPRRAVGRAVPRGGPSAARRTRSAAARGAGLARADRSARRWCCPLILAEEGREVQAYLGHGAALARTGSTHRAAVDIAADSAVHARELSEVMGREGEPWHSGGRRRHAAQHRLRLQRRPDRELRSRGRRRRRGRGAAHRDHQRASPARSPTRCRWARAATWPPRARPRSRRTRSRWSGTRCG